MVSSIRRASLAALQPMRGATLAHDGQAPSGEKGDRIQTSAARLRHPPRDPRDCGRAARLPRVHHHQALPSHRSRPRHCRRPKTRHLSPLQSLQALFRRNPGRRRRTTRPTRRKRSASTSLDVARRALPQDDGIELKPDEVDHHVAEAAENFAYAEPVEDATSAATATRTATRSCSPLVSSDNGPAATPLAPNPTVIHKTVEAGQKRTRNADRSSRSAAQTKDRHRRPRRHSRRA